MSEDTKAAASRREREVFEAVQRVAGELDLELEPSAEADRRMVGVFAAPVAYSSSSGDSTASQSTDAQTSQTSGGDYESAAGSADDQEIKVALYGWASTHHDESVTTFGRYTTDPYAAVMPGGVQLIDRKFLQIWLHGKDLQGLLETWKPKNPREVELSNVRITYLSQEIASATFQAREVGEDDVPVLANGGALLVKQDGRHWKIAAVSKFADFE